jgi:hypothetical protein
MDVDGIPVDPELGQEKACQVGESVEGIVEFVDGRCTRKVQTQGGQAR